MEMVSIKYGVFRLPQDHLGMKGNFIQVFIYLIRDITKGVTSLRRPRVPEGSSHLHLGNIGGCDGVGRGACFTNLENYVVYKFYHILLAII
jgi:hypothetical protein